jgi:hypothetical protein
MNEDMIQRLSGVVDGESVRRSNGDASGLEIKAMLAEFQSRLNKVEVKCPVIIPVVGMSSAARHSRPPNSEHGGSFACRDGNEA